MCRVLKVAPSDSLDGRGRSAVSGTSPDSAHESRHQLDGSWRPRSGSPARQWPRCRDQSANVTDRFARCVLRVGFVAPRKVMRIEAYSLRVPLAGVRLAPYRALI